MKIHVGEALVFSIIVFAFIVSTAFHHQTHWGMGVPPIAVWLYGGSMCFFKNLFFSDPVFLSDYCSVNLLFVVFE